LPADGAARPSPDQLARAEGNSVPDVIAPDLEVLFCGINPGLWSAAVGHHFARPGNRFWKAIHAAGFTEELLLPFEEDKLLACGVGVTNLVGRATASAGQVSRDELRRGAGGLARKARRWRPKAVAVLGLDAFRAAFDRPKAAVGEQQERLGDSLLWLLANPSGAQARYQLHDLVAELRRLRSAIARGPPRQ